MAETKIPIRRLPDLVTETVTSDGVELPDTGMVCFGDKTTDGSFRITIDSGKLVVEQLVLGLWENVGTFG